jgi:excisionase family DNA binding protein
MSTAMPHAGRPALYTVKQTAWILGVPASRIHRAIRTGSLPTVRHRAQLQIPATAVAQLLAHTASPVDTPTRHLRTGTAHSGGAHR